MTAIKILILEDDKWLAESFAQALESDFDVKICHDPESCLDIVESWRPDVMTVDMTLGTKNAVVLLHEMQSHVDMRGVPIVILSAAAAKISVEHIRSLGVRKVLDKSTISPKILRDELRNLRLRNG